VEKVSKKKTKKDAFERYWHFTFLGNQIMIDLKKRKIYSTEEPHLTEIDGQHESGLYELKYEVSN
jgi:hypothetical protein